MPRWLLIVFSLCIGCVGLHGNFWERARSYPPATTVREVDELIRGLVYLKGEYLFGDAVYSLGENESALAAIAAADTSAIRSLVACLSDGRLSQVRFRGVPVTVGMLCLEALSRTAYVQTGVKRRGFPEGWRGLPAPTSDPRDVARAHQAWKEWLREHRLVWD